MTALKQYQRLECPGVWRADSDAQRRALALSMIWVANDTNPGLSTRGLQCIRVGSQHHDSVVDSGLDEGVAGPPEQRAAFELREQLGAPWPASR